MASFTTGQAGGLTPTQLQTVPPELASEYQAADRQRRLAELLTQQGMQGQQGQMVSGRYVAPSWTQQLAQLGTAALGAYTGNKADERQTAMAQALRDRQAKSLSDYTEASRGKQAVEGGIYGPDNKLTTQTTADMYGPNMELNPQYRKVEAQAAQGPDFQKMMQIALDPYAHPILRSQAEEMLKGKVYKKGDVEYRTDLTTGKREIVGQGMPDVPSEIETAAALLGVPADPSKWTPQIRSAVDAKVNQIKKSGAASFDFSNFLGKSAVGEVGPMLVASKAGAGSAVQQADAANRILNAVNSNQLFTGAGANQKLQIAQIGDMVGATGDDAKTKINNTRQAIQGLAQLTLQGRQQMKGQGAVTESEGALAQRAISGDINFTAGEIRQLAEAAKRAGKFQYGQHQSMLTALQKDQPNAVPYYTIDANPNIFEPIPVPKAPEAGGVSPVRSRADAIIGGQ